MKWPVVSSILPRKFLCEDDKGSKSGGVPFVEALPRITRSGICPQVGSSGTGAGLARDDLLGLMRRMTKRAMTRRKSKSSTFRFVDLRWYPDAWSRGN